MFPLAEAEVGFGTLLIVFLYLIFTVYLGWLGYMRTKTAADYLIAGRKIHPFVMALSYGATFISTSAIVGFGGVAGMFGMSLLWLTFCNIFVGIFIAFVFLAPYVRRMGHRLDAHTFPELLGRRFDSKFIQIAMGLIIFLFIPLYAAAVLIGACKFISVQFGISYTIALLVFTLIIAAYVVVGGLKGVMYSDALQGSIMFIGMVILLYFIYAKTGGVITAHKHLTDLKELAPASLKAMGHQGWTAMPLFGFGDKKYDLWWTVISSITLGVGIGVLAQPQLMVRFMTVRSKMELNRAVAVGGVFILAMTGVAFTVGALSNAYFTHHGKPFTGRVIKVISAEKNQAALQLTRQEGDKWVDVMKEDKGKMVPAVVPVVLTGQQVGETIIGDVSIPIVQGRSISIVYAKSDMEQIIPAFIKDALPAWFGMVILLVLLSAAMSTLSSQFHTVGTSIGRDVYERIGNKQPSISVTRTGILIGIIIAVIISYWAKDKGIIARATGIFFGLCASAFLPTLIGALFFRRMTKAGAIASVVVGFLVTAFWLIFVKEKEAADIGLVQKFMDGQNSILYNHPNWPNVDSLLIALPLSAIVAIVVSLVTQPPSKEHLDKCFS